MGYYANSYPGLDGMGRTGREELVTVNGAISNVADVLNGPLFTFSLYDILDVVHSHFKMFVDDTKLYCEVNNEQQVESLQQYLKSLENRTET